MAFNPINWLLGLFSLDIAIDLGTANTLVHVRGKGIVINEPSWVTIDKRLREPLAIGLEAKEMVGRTPSNVVVVRPIRDGVISEFDVTKMMLDYFILKVHEQSVVPLPRPRVITANGYGDRKTRAVCHCHDLCTFAPLGFSHPLAPFFAMTKVPSMKHSVKSRSPRSCISCTNVRRITSNVPERTHSWKRRWHVWYGGYRSGISFHWAPVRMIHRIPLRISRLSRRGLPRPSARFGGSGISGLITFHCSSVRSIGSFLVRI